MDGASPSDLGPHVSIINQENVLSDRSSSSVDIPSFQMTLACLKLRRRRRGGAGGEERPNQQNIVIIFGFIFIYFC